MGTKIKRAINLVTSLKSIIGALSVSAYFMEHEKIGFWMLVFGAVMDGLIKYLNGELSLEKDGE